MSSKTNTGMSLIVKTVTRIVVSVILVFGIYIVAHGHVALGGGFAGGIIIALSFVLLILAFGRNVAVNKISVTLAANLETIGALMFLGIALLGFLKGAFFTNILSKGVPFKLFSAGTISLSNYAISLKVGIGLFSIYLAFVILERYKQGK